LKTLHLDYESRSELDISKVGLDRYCTDKSTEVILGAYAFDDEPVKLWQPCLSDMPKELEKAFYDPDIIISAWNCYFEKNITRWVLGIDIPIKRFIDVMILARYVSLPGGLGECGQALRLPADLLKMDEGTELKNMFCFPAKQGGQETLFGLSEPVYRNAESNPKEWDIFCRYCVKDVVSERAIATKLKDFKLPEQEKIVFEIDYDINERGVYTDSELADGGSFIANTIKDEYSKRLHELTKLENPNSRDQLLEWVQKQGYTFHSLGKPFVARALAGECPLTPEGKEALTIRQQSSKTSATKLVGIKNQLSLDSRLRFQYSYLGASRTGRWSSGSGE
jgi:DNA polymerase